MRNRDSKEEHGPNPSTEMILSAIESIVSDDFCADLSMGLAEGRAVLVSARHRKLAADKLEKIYRIAHSHNRQHSCYGAHADWRSETEQLLNSMSEPPRSANAVDSQPVETADGSANQKSS